MKLLYCHDGPMTVDKDGQAYPITFTEEVLSRYYTIAEELTFLTRKKLIDPTKTSIEKLNMEKFKVVGIPNLSSLQGLVEGKIKAKKILRTEMDSCDYLIARLPSQVGYLAIDMAIKMKKPFLVEVVGCTWDALWNHGSIAGKVLAPLNYLKMRRLIRKSKYTVYITKEFLQTRYPSYGKTCICPNVNINHVDNGILANRLLKIENKRDQDKIVFGLVGSLNVSYKGHETVIKAFSLIKDKMPNFRIEFLGNGNCDKWVTLAKKHGVFENIVFLGTLPSGDAVYKWMDSLDVALQPSSAEAQGRSIIEEMSRGCPVIASNVGGIVELIDPDWLIDPDDYVNLSKKIIKLIEDKELLKNQARRNFNEAKQYYKNNIELKRKTFFLEFKNSDNI